MQCVITIYRYILPLHSVTAICHYNLSHMHLQTTVKDLHEITHNIALITDHSFSSYFIFKSVCLIIRFNIEKQWQYGVLFKFGAPFLVKTIPAWEQIYVLNAFVKWYSYMKENTVYVETYVYSFIYLFTLHCFTNRHQCPDLTKKWELNTCSLQQVYWSVKYWSARGVLKRGVDEIKRVQCEFLRYSLIAFLLPLYLLWIK